MFREKILFLAVLLAAFALSFVNRSDAASITSLSVSTGVDYLSSVKTPCFSLGM